MSAVLNFNSKLPEVKTTIFTVVGKMANEYKAINLAQGFPDFAPDTELLRPLYQSIERQLQSVCSYDRGATTA